jgi:hypothetical protein
MTLSGPKACLGSMKEAKILPHFLHSAEKDSGQHKTKQVIICINLPAREDGSGLCIPKGILNCGDW